MSGIAQELDEALQQIDPRAAERITRLVREILILAKAPVRTDDSGVPEHSGQAPLLDLTAHAEPMGALTNAEIDRAIYGR